MQAPEFWADALRPVNWRGPALLLAQVHPRIADGSLDQGHYQTISPTAGALEGLLRGQAHVARMWVLASWPHRRGGMRLQPVLELVTWSTKTPQGRGLYVLKCKGDRMLAIEDDDLKLFCAESSEWKCEELRARQAQSETEDAERAGL